MDRMACSEMPEMLRRPRMKIAVVLFFFVITLSLLASAFISGGRIDEDR